MSELVDWLRQQLDEDFDAAQVAAALTLSPWTSVGPTVICAEGFPVVSHGDGEAATAQHIARWDPARVLAEVEAKRRILDVILAYEAKIDGEWGCCHSAKGIEEGRCPETPPGEIHAIRLLAQPYAGREGWREEWSA